MKSKLLLELYWSFFKIGGLTFGGGLTMLPMLERELVEKRKWVTEEEILDCYAIGQCTPGIIAVNTATFVGYKKAGVAGGIMGTLGMVSPSILIITLVANFLKAFMTAETFVHAMMGVRGVVCALLMNTVITLSKKSLKKLVNWIIAIIILILGFFTKIPTVVLVLMAAAAGIIICLVQQKKEKKNEAAKSDLPEEKSDGGTASAEEAESKATEAEEVDSEILAADGNSQPVKDAAAPENNAARGDNSREAKNE